MNENQVPSSESVNNNVSEINSSVNPTVPVEEVTNTNTVVENVNQTPNSSTVVSEGVVEQVSNTSDTPAVTPIAEVKVEAGDVNPNAEVPVVPSGEGSVQPSSEPPKSSNKSTVLLILLFVFLFAFIMGMPYIRQFINDFQADNDLSEIEKEAKEEEEKQKQEEESKKPTPTPDEEKVIELTCTSNNNVIGNYTLVETQKFYYNSKNQILSSKVILAYNFTVIDDNYNLFKQQCDENSLKYLTHEGYTMACSYGDNNIEISHEFELEAFTPIIDGDTNIQANATYQQDIETIKADLISKGYICQ